MKLLLLLLLPLQCVWCLADDPVRFLGFSDIPKPEAFLEGVAKDETSGLSLQCLEVGDEGKLKVVLLKDQKVVSELAVPDWFLIRSIVFGDDCVWFTIWDSDGGFQWNIGMCRISVGETAESSRIEFYASEKKGEFSARSLVSFVEGELVAMGGFDGAERGPDDTWKWAKIAISTKRLTPIDMADLESIRKAKRLVSGRAGAIEGEDVVEPREDVR